MPLPGSIRTSIGGLKNDLIALLEGEPSLQQVKAIVRICHANAQGAIARRGPLSHLLRVHGLNQTDLAFDCISDLFARDEDGRYKALISYFSAYEVAVFSDEEAFFHLQRLSFTKVRNGLFRLYSEMDPQLARILHNIKVAARALGTFTEVDRLGDACLTPALCETAEHLPPVDVSDLTSWLRGQTTGNEFIPELLGKVGLALRKQDQFSRVVSVVTIGLAIRALYKEKEIPQLGEPATVMDDTAMDAAKAIKDACDAVMAKGFTKYVESGKVSAEMFECYFCVISELLELRFLSNDGAGFELSESFLRMNPGMTLVEYRKKHRNKLEYLARLVQKRVAKSLQD